MKAYTDLLLKHKRKFLLLFILINLASIVGLSRLSIDTRFDIFTLEDSEEIAVYEALEEDFPQGDETLFLIQLNQLPSYEEFSKLGRLQDEIMNTPGVEKVLGPRVPVEITKESYPQLLMGLKLLGDFSPIKSYEDQVYISYTISTAEDFSFSDLQDLEDLFEESGYPYLVTGNTYLQNKILDYLLLIILFIPPIALLTLFFVFKWQMKSLKATLLSIIPAGIGALWTMGLIGWSGIQVSIVTVLAPIFTIVIGSADGLHFVAHLQEEEDQSLSNKLVKTLSMMGKPMMITTITSMVGFYSLSFMGVAAMNDLAVFAALGILLAGIATWFVVPLLLVNGFTLPPLNKNMKTPMFFLKQMWGKKSLLLALALIIFGLAFIPSITTEFHPLMFYRDFTKVSRDNQTISQVNRGAMPLYLSLKGEEPLTLDQIAMAHESFEEMSQVSRLLSLDSFNKLLDKLGPPAEGLSPIATSQFLSPDGLHSKLFIFTKDLDNQTLLALKEKADALSTDQITYEITGIQALMYEMNQIMINNQRSTLLLAFGLVFILLLLSLRSLKPALISLLPIGITSLVLYGFLGLSGISLNVFTATIFSITIGVGIDYGIHYTSVWKSFLNEGASGSKAAHQAFAYTVRPIIANALGFALGLSVLFLSPLKVHLYVASLMWVSMMVSVLLSLLLLPSLLSRFSS